MQVLLYICKAHAQLWVDLLGFFLVSKARSGSCILSLHAYSPNHVGKIWDIFIQVFVVQRIHNDFLEEDVSHQINQSTKNWRNNLELLTKLPPTRVKHLIIYYWQNLQSWSFVSNVSKALLWCFPYYFHQEVLTFGKNYAINKPFHIQNDRKLYYLVYKH